MFCRPFKYSLKVFYCQFVTLLGIILLYSCSEDKKEDSNNREPIKNGLLKPNIILIVADDMGYSDISPFGGEIQTTNLQKLADEGVIFTQFYNASRCCPSRASILTGLYPHQAGVGAMNKDLNHPSYRGYLSESTVTIAEGLKWAGYSSYHSGKWHVGDAPENWPIKRGFDRCFGLITGVSNYFTSFEGVKKPPLMVLDSVLWTASKGTNPYMTNLITDYGLEFMNEHHKSKEDSPFFLYLAYTAPHWPLQALTEDIEKYKEYYLGGWGQVRLARLERLKSLGLISNETTLPQLPSDIPNWDELSEEEKKRWAMKMSVYAAMVDRLDFNIGRVLNNVKELDFKNETIIIFLSDNGGSDEDLENSKQNDPKAPIGSKESYLSYGKPWGAVSNTPFRMYKKSLYEGGIASPFIIWSSNDFLKGKKHLIKTPAHIMDLFPTFLYLADLSYKDVNPLQNKLPLEGVNIFPAILSEINGIHEVMLWEHLDNKAIRKGDWKLVCEKGATWELFNIARDRNEMVDLSSVNIEKVKELRKLYNELSPKKGILTRKELSKFRKKVDLNEDDETVNQK